MSVASFLVLFNAVLVFLFRCRGPTAVRDLSLPRGVRTSLFRSIAAHATKFRAMTRNTLASTSSLISVFLVVVKKSPANATNNIGAIAFTVLMFYILSITGRRRSVALFGQEIPRGLLTGTLTVVIVGLVILVASILLLLMFSRKAFVSSYCRYMSTLTAINLAGKLAPGLAVTKGIVVVFAVCLKHIKPVSVTVNFSRGGGGGVIVCPRRSLVLWIG